MSDSTTTIQPNNGIAPKTLLGCLSLATQILEGILTDHPDALHIVQIIQARDLAMAALKANEYEAANEYLIPLIEAAKQCGTAWGKEHPID
jgi:hypothetical protein